MKNKIVLFITIIALSINVSAQAPQKISYQAIARDLSGNPMISSPLTVVFEIRSGSGTGSAVYAETHTPTTNQFGLFTAAIGGGSPNLPFIPSNFAGISWASGSYYLYVEVNGDPMGATQLLSVPYALHAGTASTGTPGIDGLNCWDTNGNGIKDATEDKNNDGSWDALDCRGDSGVAGPQGPIGLTGAAGSYTAGAGIDLSGNIITNTAPDQTVTITGVGAAVVSGAYPNFTINSTDNINDADADPNNERITTFALNATNDSIIIVEAGVGHAFPLSNLNDNDWTINGSDISNANIGNIGIETISPTAKLHLNGTLRLENMSGTAPAIGSVLTSMDAAGNAEWQPLPIIPTVSWSLNGGHIYNNNSGNVGIGIISPNALLHIQDINVSPFNRLLDIGNNAGQAIFSVLDDGSVGINSANPSAQFEVRESSGGDRVIEANGRNVALGDIDGGGAGANLFINGDGTGNFQFMGGNVGIGTTTPAIDLHINGNTAIEVPSAGNFARGLTRLSTNDSPLVFDMGIADDVYTGGWLQVHNGSNMATNYSLLLNPNGGNVGIGTTTPVQKLQVANGNDGAIRIGNHANWYGEFSYDYGQGDLRITSGNSSTATGADIIFTTYGTDKMIINGLGNVGIGTLSPSQKLDVDAGGSIQVDGEYTYETAKVHYQSYAPTAFRALLPDAYSFGTYLAADYYTYFRSGGTAFGYATVGVNLPNGAVITNLEAWIWDNLSTNPVRVTLCRQQLGSDVIAQMAEVESLAATSIASIQNLTDGTISNSIIDNQNYAYFLMFTGRQNSQDSRLYGTKLTYTVTKAD